MRIPSQSPALYAFAGSLFCLLGSQGVSAVPINAGALGSTVLVDPNHHLTTKLTHLTSPREQHFVNHAVTKGQLVSTHVKREEPKEQLTPEQERDVEHMSTAFMDGKTSRYAEAIAVVAEVPKDAEKGPFLLEKREQPAVNKAKAKAGGRLPTIRKTGTVGKAGSGKTGFWGSIVNWLKKLFGGRKKRPGTPKTSTTVDLVQSDLTGGVGNLLATQPPAENREDRASDRSGSASDGAGSEGGNGKSGGFWSTIGNWFSGIFKRSKKDSAKNPKTQAQDSRPQEMTDRSRIPSGRQEPSQLDLNWREELVRKFGQVSDGKLTSISEENLDQLSDSSSGSGSRGKKGPGLPNLKDGKLPPITEEKPDQLSASPSDSNSAKRARPDPSEKAGPPRQNVQDQTGPSDGGLKEGNGPAKLDTRSLEKRGIFGKGKGNSKGGGKGIVRNPWIQK